MKKKNVLNSTILELTTDRKNDIYRTLKQYDNIYIYGMGESSRKAVNFLKGIGIFPNGLVCEAEDEDYISPNIDIPVTPYEKISSKNSVFIVFDSVYQDEVTNLLISRNTVNIAQIKVGVRGNYNTLVDRNRPKIEITTKLGCDIQCRFCPQQVLYNSYFKNEKKRTSYMSLDLFTKLLDHIPEDCIVEFAGMAEPFLNKECVDMMLLANKKGFQMELFTTFVGLNEADLEKIKDIPFNLVGFHTPDEMGYSKINQTDEYKRIVDRVLDMEKADGTSFVDLANCQSMPDSQFMNEVARDRLYVVSAPLCDRAGNLTEGEFVKVERRHGKIICASSRNMDHFVVLPDGEVVLCNMDYGMQHILGNLSTMTYKDIIESDTFKNIIDKMNVNDSNLICRNCFLSHTIDRL